MGDLRTAIYLIAFAILGYGLLLGIETLRFDTSTGVKPLINIKEVEIRQNKGSNLRRDKYTGLGYTFEYEYLVPKADSKNSKSEIIRINKGKFKLFNRVVIRNWAA